MHVQIPPWEVFLMVEVINPAAVECGASANNTVNLVALIQQLPGHVGAILASHTGNEGSLLLAHVFLQVQLLMIR
jgi:hypothetical protein